MAARPSRLLVPIQAVILFGWLCFLALPALADSANASGQCSRVIVSADPEFPPFAWYDGQKLGGASLDVVTMVLNRMQLPY